MRNKKRVLIKYTALMLILLSALLLSACRTRITNNNEVSNVYNDEDGILSETYEMRRSELGLSTAKKPLLPDFGSNDDEEQDFDTGESFTYEPEEEEYVEPPEVQNANRTNTSRTTNRSTTRTSSSGGGGSTRKSKERVTITFNPNGGKCNTTEKKVYKGSKIGKLPEATKDGKTTTTWTTSKNGGSAVKSSDTVNSNITLYASWGEEKKEYTVTFNGNGGIPNSTTKTFKKGEKIKFPENPSKEGENFAGWYTKSSGGDKISTSQTVNGNQTVYAHWTKKITYNVEFDPDGGEFASGGDPITVEEGKSYGNLPTLKTRKGYKFEGWFDGDTEVSASDKPDSNKTLVAHWEDTYEKWNKALDENNDETVDSIVVNGGEEKDSFLENAGVAIITGSSDWTIAFVGPEDFDDPDYESYGTNKVIVVSTEVFGNEVDQLFNKIKILNIMQGKLKPDDASDDLNGTSYVKTNK